ncbi:hypothetical protein RRG08_009868 [Elysia crispata]|uniref:Uncharacterized protein n=1 Tax=Elysia crispata TaxID=231223 RepID=A0AAE1DA91_9GAST|nr:hypothetical protein RRG08_009868 [Elysia crispata]
MYQDISACFGKIRFSAPLDGVKREYKRVVSIRKVVQFPLPSHQFSATIDIPGKNHVKGASLGRRPSARGLTAHVGDNPGLPPPVTGAAVSVCARQWLVLFTELRPNREEVPACVKLLLCASLSVYWRLNGMIKRSMEPMADSEIPYKSSLIICYRDGGGSVEKIECGMEVCSSEIPTVREKKRTLTAIAESRKRAVYS